jgi:hypothetical protein
MHIIYFYLTCSISYDANLYLDLQKKTMEQAL